MPNPALGPITLENTRIIFRNFSGAPGKFNPQGGKRTFNIILDEELASSMINDGWNVKFLQPRDEDEEPTPRLEVEVKFEGRPPRIVLVTSRNKTRLTKETISVLDWAEITNVDCIIRPYEWEVNGRTGVKAYCQSLFVTIREDELEQKYADVPDSAMAAVVGDPDEDE